MASVVGKRHVPRWQTYSVTMAIVTLVIGDRHVSRWQFNCAALESPLELAKQIPCATGPMHQLVKAQAERCGKSYTSGYVFLLHGRRDEIAVLDGNKHTGKLSDAKEECTLAEDKTVAEMAVEEIDNHVVEGSRT